ncbi:hypothetical protein Tco_1199398 [Tanacetum coccineum]
MVVEHVSPNVISSQDGKDKGEVNLQDVVRLMEIMVCLLKAAENIQASPVKVDIPPILTLIIHPSEVEALEKVTPELEPKAKTVKFLIPNPTTLNSMLPQNMSMGQFIDNLFKTTTSDYSLTPLKDESKGKGIASEEDQLKALMTLEVTKELSRRK